ncbi:sn-glycerol-3-phosphate-binding periplasmic protein UgpB [Andreprevotia sp. IGB-42]|uniref:ABC transporter substrate-binding protein n=1 Tax=Andreprevotia sp. IGB-42 TaxID=2497473 RepID=UPI00135A7E36|nr:sugar ABC transporter substrate-binding protein [Andreprevotia sp. IGB-42]KAF0811340.1 sn-glycerol-3-phosphate-binding periplasmic protein UgpB [Andreprevotia sp. IGB-42]
MFKRCTKPLLLLALLAPALAHADRTKVEFWTFNTVQFAPFFNDVIQKYNKANPNYEAVWTDMNWDQIQPKLVSAIAAGTPPALVNFNVPWTHEFANKNLLLPLDDLMGEGKTVYLPGALKDLSVKERIYGFPYYNSVSVIAYNKDLLAKSGIKTPPKTFDEFIAAARLVTEKTGVPAFSPKLATKSGDGGMIPWFVYMGLPIFENGKAAFTSKKHVEALELFADLYKKGVVPKDSFRIEFEQEIASYGAGRLAMMTTAPTALKKLSAQSNAMYEKTAIMAFPLGGANMALGGWLMSFVMPKGTKDPQAAAKLGLLLTNDDAQLAFAKATGTTFPSSKKANENEFFSSGANGSDPVGLARATAARSMAYARTPILPAENMPDEAAMRTEFNDEMQEAIEGRKSAKAALDAAARKWNDRLAKK